VIVLVLSLHNWFIILRLASSLKDKMRPTSFTRIGSRVVLGLLDTRSEGGVASTSRPNKEKTPGFQGTVSVAGCLLDGGYSQEGGSLTEGPVDADTCKHTN